jgi:hypothetical protein
VLLVLGEQGAGSNLALAMVWALVVYLDLELDRLRERQAPTGAITLAEGVTVPLCQSCVEAFRATGCFIPTDPPRPALSVVKPEVPT